MNPIKRSLAALILPTYLILFLLLSLLNNSYSFIISGFIYSTIIVFITLLQKKENSYYFLLTVASFALIYSFYATLSNQLLIQNPYKDYFTNWDSEGFYAGAVDLSRHSYSLIWQKAFTQFGYSGFPLFAAIMGTLQKWAGLSGVSGLLFQKLNVSFLAGFIPGIIYLICSRAVSQKKAFRAAIIYGLCSFIFIYAVDLARDIHIALIYAIGIYIITGKKESLKNYIALIILAVLAFFLRLENGLFFLAFIGALVLHGKGRSKYLIGSIAIIATGLLVVKIGGISFILDTAMKTQDIYSNRAATMYGNSGSSLGMKLLSLPIPFNYIGATIFGQITPFPFWAAFEKLRVSGGWVLFFPKAVAAIFWFSVWMRFLLNRKATWRFIKEYKYIVIVGMLYIVMVSMTQTMPRRLMAVYPIIYLGYISITKYKLKKHEYKYDLIVFVGLIACYLALKLI